MHSMHMKELWRECGLRSLKRFHFRRCWTCCLLGPENIPLPSSVVWRACLRPQEELGTSATRMLKAAQSTEPQDAKTAAEKAEGLLRALDAILPKEVED